MSSDAQGDSKRVFSAIEVPAGIREMAARRSLELGSKFPDAGAKWADPGKMHLTVRFFGSVNANTLTAIIDSHRSVAAVRSPFELTVQGPGVFPGPHRPRVLWLGFDRSEHLSGLRSATDLEMEKKGLLPEERSFRPHLTIARLKNPSKAKKLAREHLSLNFEPVAFDVTRIGIFESVLKPTGSEYSLIESCEFCG